MKSMQFLLKLLGTSVLSTAGAISVVACNNNTAVTAADISTGITISDLRLAADPDSTFSDLNTNATVNSAVASAINTTKNVSVVSGIDFVVSNDRVANAQQTIGSTVKFTVTGISDQIKGSFSFINTLSKPDISKDVEVTRLKLDADQAATYGSLNTNEKITDAIAEAINYEKNVNVVYGVDFLVANDQVESAMQSPGTTVTFTVTATGKQITGSFNFSTNLGKTNISTGIIVPDLKTGVNQKANYGDLNTNADIINSVVDAINTAKKTNITASDISISNDQPMLSPQAYNVPVTFTVTANSDKITGSFSFVDTLGKTDISSGVSVPTFANAANPSLTYGSLNTNTYIINKILSAINSNKNTTANANDITITNDQSASALQSPGALVTFTVAAKNTSQQLTGSFTFTHTLGMVNISSGVTIADPQTAAVANTTYVALNTNTSLINTVVTAINNAKKTNITSSDIVLTNNKGSANQTPGAVVTINVAASASSQLITGGFSFIDTLQKANISSGVTITDPQTAVDNTTTFNSLNTNTALTNIVATAINNAKGTTVTANDFTLTNNQTGNQVAGTVATFTVTANANSPQISGSFTFTNTLGKINISTGVTVTNPSTPPDTSLTYSALNSNPVILATIVNAINTAKNSNINTNDFILTNDQPATANQALGTTVTFTVTGTGNKLTGSFTFTNTLAKADLASGALVFPDLILPYNPAQTFESLTTNPTVVASIVNTFYSYKGVNIAVGTDFTNTVNFTGPQRQNYVVLLFVNAVSTSTKLINNSMFFIYLQ